MASWYLACGLGAQQLPVTTLPLDHAFDAHPAAAGADTLIHVSLWQRSPWTGVPSAPRTTSLALTSPTGSSRLGWGARAWSDIAGPTRMAGVHMGLAYTSRWTERWNLSFGMGLGWMQFSVDGNQIELEEAGDPVLGDTYQTIGVPDASAGLSAFRRNVHPRGVGQPGLGCCFAGIRRDRKGFPLGISLACYAFLPF